jgi:hypothetical protein
VHLDRIAADLLADLGGVEFGDRRLARVGAPLILLPGRLVDHETRRV